MSLPAVYYLCDPTSAVAGPPGGQSGAGSGTQISPEFTAPSLAAATQVAYICSTAWQRPVLLVTKFGGSPPGTLVVGQAAALAITACPSGIGY